jgi:very-short-patch-repair endonuclease
MMRAVADIEVHSNINGYSVDIYVKDWKLAIEYQGQQHYTPIHRGDWNE